MKMRLPLAYALDRLAALVERGSDLRVGTLKMRGPRHAEFQHIKRRRRSDTFKTFKTFKMFGGF
jgi:hypothetical protein